MVKTKYFRDQHVELLTIASEISAQLNVNKLSNDASEVSELLSKLLNKLTVHLSMEDEKIYPKLLRHHGEKIKTIAQKFIDEMGGIGKVVAAYADKWFSASEIQKNPSTFITETNNIFDALANRIERENKELYKIIDEL